MSATWAQIADAFGLVARTLKLEWQCELPPFDSLPSPALEAIVDEWCDRLAADMTSPLNPPEIVKPWILARLISNAGNASNLAKSGDTDAPGLTPSTARWFLIDEWHGCLRDRWTGLMPLDDSIS